MAFHRVKEYERLIVFSISGKFKGIRGPGLVYINPFTERVDGAPVDLRETPLPLQPEKCLTKDNVPVTLEVIAIYKIADPHRMRVTVTDASTGIINFTRSTLRAVVGSMDMSDVVSQRETIAAQLRARIAPEAERWGIEVLNVDISALQPDPNVERAMSERKASVERAHAEARAAVLRAEADRDAAVAHREASLARAEMERQTAILQAQGEREAQILRAEGVAAYYQRLVDLGSGADVVLRFEANEALKQLARSPNAKLVLAPMEAFRSGSPAFRTLKLTEEPPSTADAEDSRQVPVFE